MEIKSFFKQNFLALTFVGLSAASAQAQFSGTGAGTSASPYMITNAQQLDEVRNDLTAHCGQLANNGMGFYNRMDDLRGQRSSVSAMATTVHYGNGGK
jgi:hypothetical protein